MWLCQRRQIYLIPSAMLNKGGPFCPETGSRCKHVQRWKAFIDVLSVRSSTCGPVAV